MSGFVYPNEINVPWNLLIVLYPYITGLVAGAFIVSSLCHVFGRDRLRPVFRLALVTALAFLMVATVPLLLHLGQPLRAFEIMWTPNPTSAMAGFGYIYSFYMIILLLEVWFVFREDLVHYAKTKKGISGLGYRLLTLGAYDTSSHSLKSDHRIVTILATIGIPAAAFLHGYVGFIFGSIKANAVWSTPLMPVIFLMSAIVSGISALTLVYAISCAWRRVRMDFSCLMALNKYLWYFLMVDLGLELLEVVQKLYENKEEWGAISGLLTRQIPFSYFGLQLIMGAFIPLVLLAIARSSKVSAGIRKAMTLVCTMLIVVGVFAMRFNVVIGGQLVSKSLAGYTTFHAPFLGMEGILPVILILAAPIMILIVLTRIIPPWEKEEPAGVEEQRRIQAAV
ncbi:MAG: NrfD/PsrC family molybdoenzyme membrane anchor subunit [Bacillota bacterium]